MPTHTVFNQSAPLVDYNAYAGDAALRDAVGRHGAGWAEAELLEHGLRTGNADVIDWGFLANEFPPRFESHDRTGARIDKVTYHESYHRLMEVGLTIGLHSSPWTTPRPGAHVARAALYYLQAQVESGHGCPLTMTFASVPTLRLTPGVADAWLPKVLANGYDPRNIPYAEKPAVTLGMGMTEKQGGSDVRSNTTKAVATGPAGPGQAYELTGHKWFTSAPMSDGFLMLAQVDEGPTCFLVPRWRPDGSKNPVLVQRLKNKLGNVSNASAEIELEGAFGWMIGEPGRGIRSIIEMVAMTRFDCMIGSSASERQAVAQAVNHARARHAFGKALIDQPLMANVLADLQLEVEGSLALTMRMAEALDRVQGGEDEREAKLLRLGLPVGKYWVCKRAPGHAYEAMECLGGNGVIEDFITARLYRDAPINAIWEGSGNIQALDVLRAIRRDPAVVDAWFDELAATRGQSPELDAAEKALRRTLSSTNAREYLARHLVQQLALTMQASLLLRADCTAVGDAFIASRIAGNGLATYGALPAGVDVRRILERADPLVT